MKISMHDMTIHSLVPMLTSLGEWLDKGAAEELVEARLAPDMYTLAQQVQQACYHARDTVARLTGEAAPATEAAESTMAGLKRQIAGTIAAIRETPASAFAGAEERDCSVPLPDELIIKMDGLTYLRAWTLPHFYFHVVTAYGILRHRGVELGKRDYLSQLVGNIVPA